MQVQEEFPFYPSMTSASFAINFSTAPLQVERMIQLALDEIGKVEVTPPSVDELKKALEIYKHTQAKALQTNMGKIQRISDNIAFGKELDSYVEDSLGSPLRARCMNP